MINSTLLEALGSLSKEEFRELGLFINSPFFNNRNEVIRFYAAIKKHYPDFDPDKLDEEKVYNLIYPGKKFSGVLMRKIYSLFTKLFLDYISISAYRENELDYNVKMLYRLYDKQLKDLFVKKSRTFEVLLDNSKHSIEYYEAKFKFTSKLNAFRNESKEKGNIEIYQAELNEFIEYFASVILLLFHRLMTFSNIYNTKYQMWFYVELFSYLNQHGFEHKTIVSIYYHMVKLFETEQEYHFRELINYSKRFDAKLTPMFKNNVFITMFNHCLNRIYKGESEFRKHLFDISKLFANEKQLMGEQKFINPFLFTGIVRNSAYLKEFRWTEDFIKEFRKHLEPGSNTEVLNYTNAMLEFEKGNFEKSLAYLSGSNPDKLVMKINAKNLQLMLYFELGYNDELISLIDTYKHYLNNNTSIGETQKQRNVRFVNAVSELLKIKLRDDPVSTALFLKKMEESEYFILKEWIEAKLKKMHN